MTPSALLRDTLRIYHMSRSELSRRSDLSPWTIRQLVAGKKPITPEIALCLERVLGVRAEVWLEVQWRYELEMAEKD